MGKGEPRHKPPMTELERVIWTLMCTDDYTVLAQTENAAILIYIHDDPPQRQITITIGEQR